MLYLTLFWTFFKVGLFTIGGGYAMIPIISAEVLSHGWLTPDTLLDFIAISESTPGAFAVNIATFVGVETGGIFGALCATTGLVAPSLIIIFVLAKFFTAAKEKTVIKDMFAALRPAVVGLLFAVSATMFLQVVFNNDNILALHKNSQFDYKSLIIFCVMFALSNIPFKSFKKAALPATDAARTIKMHPIVIILSSAVLGILLYSF